MKKSSGWLRLTRLNVLLLGFPVLVLTGCSNNDKGPDVSGIRISLDVQRFDKDFFALDTNRLDQGMTGLQQKYPEFLQIFLQRIAGVTNGPELRGFYASYRPVYDSSARVFRDMEPFRDQVLDAFKHVHHYYPKYELPGHLLTVLGPMNSRDDLARMRNGDLTPNFLGPGFLGISLQFYLGSNFSFYRDQYFVNQVAPLYRSRRFSPEYLAADAMRLIVDDIYPDKSRSLALLEQMVEKGKQWYLLDKLMPAAPDSVKTGYTAGQLAWVNANEGLIWNYILTNEKLDATEPATIQAYLGEGPFTQGMDQDHSPGNLGQWIGLRIIQKYAGLHADATPEAILNTPVRQIIEEAKYRPK